MARRGSADLARASRLYRSFRERTPTRARAVSLQYPKAVMVMGHVRAILYDTTHGAKMIPYKHTFARGSRPLLAAGTRRGELYIIGTRFHVTDRGIVDLDARGREIDDGGGHR